MTKRCSGRGIVYDIELNPLDLNEITYPVTSDTTLPLVDEGSAKLREQTS